MKPPTHAISRRGRLRRGRAAHRARLDFRLDNGYKSGAYEKTWEGREDNEHMAEILGRLGPGPALADQLYGELERKYRSRKER